ncbi:hypothetical protein V8V91_08960 [Algoriphagus halophilus]|uniref:hypothetical protein n=1 Tax=Algoriphagus halophilus TaxID=226505 RepID=UPI00358FC7DA
MHRWIVSCVLLVGFFASAKAQEKCLWVKSSDYVQPAILDSLSILEESIRVKGSNGETYAFQYDLNTNEFQVIFRGASLPDSVNICYQTFSIRLDQAVARRTLLADYDSMAQFRDTRLLESPTFDFREELFQVRISINQEV